MSSTETRAFTVRVPVEQAEALELIAKADGISVAEEVRGALQERIEARKADPEFMALVKATVERSQAALDLLAK
ncbi:ribbon-helix-helix protein, CopG family [Catenulispora subtropica]|uniref:CopG domain protein DNA-binding domain protein n=1 Tax=Catenulispora subtropica TaxID=450798 RepID=A0ABP5EJJ0_9ACTN